MRLGAILIFARGGLKDRVNLGGPTKFQGAIFQRNQFLSLFDKITDVSKNSQGTIL